MNYKGFKKVKEDDDKAILKNGGGHSITIAKKSLSKGHLEMLKKLPLHAAEGADTENADESSDQPESKTPGVNIYVGNGSNQSGGQSTLAPQPAPQEPAANPQPQQTGANVGAAAAVPPPAQQQGNAAGANVGGAAIVPPEQGGQSAAPQPEAPPDPKAIHLQHYLGQDQATENDLNSGHITPKTYHALFESKSTLGKIGTLFGLMAAGAGSGLTGQPNVVLQMMNKEIENDLTAQQNSKTNAQNLLRINQAQLLQEAQIPKLIAEGKLTQQQAHMVAQQVKQSAYTLAQMQANRFALHSLVTANNKLPAGSPARQQGDQMLALMFQAVNNENFNIADRAASAGSLLNFGGNSQGGSNEAGFQGRNTALRMSGNEKLATDAESKHFPGLEGQASVPLNGNDREKIDTGITFDRKLNDFINFTKKHSGSLSPSTIKEGETLAAELQGAYRQATHGGVYKESEQNFISKLIDENPTKFFNSIRVMPQLKALAKENANRVDQTVKNLGFSGYKPNHPVGNEESGPKEGDKITTKSGRTAVWKNGKYVYK